MPCASLPYYCLEFTVAAQEQAQSPVCPDEEDVAKNFRSFTLLEIVNTEQLDLYANILLCRRRSGRELVVAFRGTESKANVWLDAEFKRVKQHELCRASGDKCYVHSGFSNGYAAMKADGLLDRVRQHCRNHSISLVWATGHSLGGALATLFVADWVASKLPDEVLPEFGLFTIGSPRVGNRGFTDFVDRLVDESRKFRVVADYDPVPYVPRTDCIDLVAPYLTSAGLSTFTQQAC